MGLRGKKPTIETASDLKKAVEAYFNNCKANEVFPDYAGMLLFIGITEKYAKYLQSDECKEAEECQNIFAEAKLRRESFLSRRMVTEPKVANGCMNALKQEKNGGYIDKPKNEGGETKLTINFTGIGGETTFKG